MTQLGLHKDHCTGRVKGIGSLKKSSDPALDFALESYKLLRAVPLYPKSRKLKLGYIDTFLPVAEKQLLIAGGRLARLLNVVLGN